MQNYSTIKKTISKEIVFFGTPDWIRTSGLQSRSYQAVKRKILAAQLFHPFCTNRGREYKKTENRCTTTTPGFFMGFSE